MAAFEEPSSRKMRDVYNHRFSGIGLSLTVMVAFRLLVQIIIELVIYVIDPSLASQWWYGWVLSIVPLYGAALPAMYLLLRGVPVYLPKHLSDSGDAAAVKKMPFRARWIFPLFVTGMGYMYIGNIIGTGVMTSLSDWMGHAYGDALTPLVEASPMWVFFLGSVIIAPLGEEFIFRKLLIDRMRCLGDVPAILLSAFFFALFHGNFYQFFYAFALGILLGYVYTYTGKLRLPVILHMLFNFMGGVLPSWVMSLVDPSVLTSTDPGVEHIWSYILLVFYQYLIYGFMVASVVLTVVFCARRRVYLNRGEISLGRGERLGVMLGNPGMLLAFFVGVLVFGMSLLPL